MDAQSVCYLKALCGSSPLAGNTLTYIEVCTNPIAITSMRFLVSRTFEVLKKRVYFMLYCVYALDLLLSSVVC